MKKIKNMFVVVLIFIGLLMISTNVQAATSSIKLEKIEVTSPKSGEYKTGQEITIVTTFSDDIVGTKDGVPYLTIVIGENSRVINEGTISGKTVTYKYKIDSLDGGILKLGNIEGGSLKDKSGNDIDIKKPSSMGGAQIKVNSISWTDVSKAKFVIDNDYQLKCTGIEEIENHNYYVYISNSKGEPKLEKDSIGKPTNATIDFLLKSVSVKDNLEMNSDIYVSIYETQLNNETGKYEGKFIINSQKVERPAQKKLGTRTKGSFHNDKTNTFLYEPYDFNGKRNIKLKIGVVNDISILRSIQKGEAGALSKLLAYAKKSSSIYTGTVPLGESGTITKNMNLVDRQYYYVYMQLDDENGKYYPVEDVSLYQGFVGPTIGKNLYDYLSNEFKWNLGEEEKKEDTKNPTTELKNSVASNQAKDDTVIKSKKLPQTGETIVICIAVVGAATLVVIFGIKFRKYHY